MEVVLNLSDQVYSKAAHLAGLLNQELPRVLAETIEHALSPLGSSEAWLQPVTELPDQELLKLADLRMETAQGERMGVLLERQQSGTLDDPARQELAALTQVYHENLVRKAQALRETVRRGLREPITP